MRKRLKENFADAIKFDGYWFYEKLERRSPFYKLVFDDVMDYIDEHFNSYAELLAEYPEYNDFTDCILGEDSITGCDSGSVTFNSGASWKNIFGNGEINDSLELLIDCLDETDPEWGAKYLFENLKDRNYDRLDCTIRDYLCSSVAEFIYERIEEDDLAGKGTGGVELADEDYDEGFDESAKRHRARIRK